MGLVRRRDDRLRVVWDLTADQLMEGKMLVIGIIILYLLVGRLWYLIHKAAFGPADDGWIVMGGLLWPTAIVIEVFLGVFGLAICVVTWDWDWLIKTINKIQEKWGPKNGRKN